MDTPTDTTPAKHGDNSARTLSYRRDWALFLDVDGTLIDIASDPYHVQVKAGTGELIRQLHERLHGALALISGRRLSDLDRLFSLPQLPAAGLHGMERRLGDDRPVYVQSIDKTLMENFRRQLLEFTSQHPGLLLEDKGLSIAVHFRRAPELQEQVEQILARVIDGYRSEFHIQNGKMIAELKPRHSNKGRALLAFMQEKPFAGRTPVFIGDDITDEDGFMATHELNGISIKVGAGTSCARHRLSEPSEVIDWLGGYLNFLSTNA